MSTVVEKICEPNGKVFYQLTINLQNGSKKVEKYERAFDAQKRQRHNEEDSRRNVTTNHYM